MFGKSDKGAQIQYLICKLLDIYDVLGEYLNTG